MALILSYFLRIFIALLLVACAFVFVTGLAQLATAWRASRAKPERMPCPLCDEKGAIARRLNDYEVMVECPMCDGETRKWGRIDE